MGKRGLCEAGRRSRGGVGKVEGDMRDGLWAGRMGRVEKWYKEKIVAK